MVWNFAFLQELFLAINGEKPQNVSLLSDHTLSSSSYFIYTSFNWRRAWIHMELNVLYCMVLYCTQDIEYLVHDESEFW